MHVTSLLYTILCSINLLNLLSTNAKARIPRRCADEFCRDKKFLFEQYERPFSFLRGGGDMLGHLVMYLTGFLYPEKNKDTQTQVDMESSIRLIKFF